ncbi:MAG: 2Fe-2S iron-sulfur cluster-binding protein [Pseudomonadota bacterium]
MPVESSRLYPLTVKDIARETAEAISVAFAVTPDMENLYAYQHGQYITVEVDIDGEKLRRAYSIVSGLDDGELRIGVKKTNGGLVSSFLNDNLKIGDTVYVMPPLGRFTAPLNVDAQQNHLFIAAGSGITPILSIMSTVLSREPHSRALLIYGNKRQADIMFLETIEQMKNTYLDRLALVHVLSRESGDIEILNGRIDMERVGAILKAMMPAASISHVFMCGPGTMLDEVQNGLGSLGVNPQKIHREIFTPGEGRHGTPVTVGKGERTEGEAEAELILDGRRHQITVKKDETVIEAAHRAGIEAPYSCKGGMCCTCRARVVEGAVEMQTNYSLEPWELEAGFVLTCQAKPKSEKLVIDYDAR